MTIRRPPRMRALTKSAGIRFRGSCVAAFGLVLAGGCSSSQSSTAPAPAAPPAPVEHGTLAERVEAGYVIGPAAARQLAYRIDWQYPALSDGIALLAVEGDSVVALDNDNFLMLIERDSGQRLWRIPAASEVERVLGINYLPHLGKIYLTTGGAVLVHDATTGSQLGRQRLQKIANTPPVVVDQFFVYGSRGGQLVWHSYLLGSSWRGYQVAGTISVPPVLSDGYLITVGGDGRLMCLIASAAKQVWSRTLLAPVVAPPVAGNGAAYVAGLDQYVRAYELREPRSPLWAYLSESALRSSPTLIDDRVYQQIPSEGLVCFEALPLDQPGGVVLWRAPDVRGSVVTTRLGRLITWDPEDRALEIVDARLGALIERIELPDASQVMATAVVEGDLFATGSDGRIERLVPR